MVTASSVVLFPVHVPASSYAGELLSSRLPVALDLLAPGQLAEQASEVDKR